jgi:hypothetical protein
MRTLLTGFVVGMLSLAGTGGLLALARLALIQVRDLRRLARQLSDPTDQPGGPWEFSDGAPPPGWALPPASARIGAGAAPVGLGVRGRWS